MKVLVAIPMKENLHPYLKRQCKTLAQKMLNNNPSHVLDIIIVERGISGQGYDQERYSHIAEKRNHIIDNYLTDHECVMWIDADIVRYNPNLPTILLSASPGNIVAPLVFWDKHRPHFYDVGGFVQNGKWARNMPPYWNYGYPLSDMDSVGCCYVIPADVYRNGAKYEVTDGFTEHLSVCRFAKDMGIEVKALMNESIAHAFLDEYTTQDISYPDGTTYTLYVRNTFDIHPHWKYFNEPETMQWLVDNAMPEWVCMDIGAGAGEMALWLADHTCHVTAVEANTEVAHMLGDSADMAKSCGLHVISALVGNGKSTDKVSYAGMMSPSRVNAVTTTIDDIVTDYVDFIKIDVDGMDYDALLGARETIESCGPIIMIEFDDKSLSRYGRSTNDIHEFLTSIGYYQDCILDKEHPTNAVYRRY